MGRFFRESVSLHLATVFAIVILMGSECFLCQASMAPTSDFGELKTDVQVDDANHLDGILASEVLLTGLDSLSILSDVRLHLAPPRRHRRGSNRAPPAAFFGQA